MSITKEYLDGLPNKKAVVAVAEGLGLDTSGTRKEITERILANAVEPAAPVAPEPAPAAPEPVEVPTAPVSRFVGGILPVKAHLIRP